MKKYPLVEHHTDSLKRVQLLQIKKCNVATIETVADSRAKRNGLSEADLHIFAKLFEQGLERGEEAEALARREIVAEHDLLQLGVAQRVEVEVAGQVAPQPPVGVLHRPFLPGRVGVAE